MPPISAIKSSSLSEKGIFQKETISGSNSCFHCGLEVTGKSYQEGAKSFCCLGCLTVFQLLSSSGMQQFYQLQSAPGNSMKVFSAESNVYDYLDDKDLQQRILQFQEGENAVITLKIPGIHCVSCVWLLENLHQIDSGIKKATVNFLKKNVRVRFNIRELPLSKLAKILDSIGYSAEFNWQNFKKINFYKSHEEIIKLGVAGFCFGNVMMLAFPEYLSIDVPEKFKYFFGIISLVFCLPVMFYAALDWFDRAFKAVKNKHFSLDIPIVNGLLVLFTISAYEVLINQRGGYQDSLCAFVFFMLLARYFQRLTFDNISFEGGLLSYFPMSVMRIYQDERRTIPLAKIQINDALYIRHAEVVPVDSILESTDCLIDYSYLTGESQPVSVVKGAIIRAGGKVQGKAIEVRAINQLKNEILEQIWEDSERGSHKKNLLFADKISPYFISVIYSVAILGGATQYYLSNSFSFALFCFASVLIITCPCALAISAPLVHGMMQRKFSRKGFYLRSGSLIESLNEIDTIIFDKTGTITEPGKELISVFDKMTLSERNAIGSLASNSLHPVSRKLAELNKSDLHTSDFEEIVGCGIKGRVNGIDIQLGSADWLIKSGFDLPNECSVVPRSSLLVIAAKNKIVAVYQMRDIFRKNWQNAIQQLSHHFDLHVLSGDTDASREILISNFSNSSQIHFQFSPEQKGAYVKALKQNNKKVMMVGDGLNDQLALQEAQIGVAITEEAGHFSPDSDILLLGNSWNRLNDFIFCAKAGVKLIHLNFGFSFIYNVIGVLVALSGYLTPFFTAILMPISSLTVVVTAILGSKVIFKLRKL